MIPTMTDIRQKVDAINWPFISESMHEKGYAVIPGFLTHNDCQNLLESYDNPAAYRKTVIMERYRFGLGEYKYFNYPLPDVIQNIRECVYPCIAPIANT